MSFFNFFGATKQSEAGASALSTVLMLAGGISVGVAVFTDAIVKSSAMSTSSSDRQVMQQISRSAIGVVGQYFERGIVKIGCTNPNQTKAQVIVDNAIATALKSDIGTVFNQSQQSFNVQICDPINLSAASRDALYAPGSGLPDKSNCKMTQTSVKILTVNCNERFADVEAKSTHQVATVNIDGTRRARLFAATVPGPPTPPPPPPPTPGPAPTPTPGPTPPPSPGPTPPPETSDCPLFSSSNNATFAPNQKLQMKFHDGGTKTIDLSTVPRLEPHFDNGDYRFLVAYWGTTGGSNACNCWVKTLPGNIGEHSAYVLFEVRVQKPNEKECQISSNYLSTHYGHGCLDADSRIKMADGSFKKLANIHGGEQILNPITRLATGVSRIVAPDSKHPVLQITTQSGTLRLTSNHPVRTSQGTTTAGALHVGDSIASADHSVMTVTHIETLTKEPELLNLVLDPSEGVGNDGHFFEVEGGFITGDLVIQKQLEGDESPLREGLLGPRP